VVVVVVVLVLVVVVVVVVVVIVVSSSLLCTPSDQGVVISRGAAVCADNGTQAVEGRRLECTLHVQSLKCYHITSSMNAGISEVSRQSLVLRPDVPPCMLQLMCYKRHIGHQKDPRKCGASGIEWKI
jgi:hypothetical protein